MTLSFFGTPTLLSEVGVPHRADALDPSARRLRSSVIQTGCTIVGSEGWRRDIAHALGLRVSTLTYSEGSMLGDGCNEPNDRGLTAFGRQAVQDLNRLGITVDISHVGGRTASEIVTRSASSMIAVAAIGPTGGHADAWKVSGARAYHWMPHPGHPLAMADGVEEMRRTARELMRAGADVLKVCATGGVMSVRDSPHHEQFSAEEMQVLVDEAARLGKHVMAHAQGGVRHRAGCDRGSALHRARHVPLRSRDRADARARHVVRPHDGRVDVDP